MVLSRERGEVILVDLRPLIEVARLSAGKHGGIVEDAILDFLGDKLQIGVMLVEVKSHQEAKIGIDCARGIGVDREEIFWKKESARMEGK